MVLKAFVSILLSLVFAVLASLSINTFTNVEFEFWYYISAYFVVTCLLMNLLYALKSGDKSFTEIIIFSFSLKLLLAFFAVFIYSFLYPRQFSAFATHFLLQYLLFTIFEIRYLFQLIRHNQKTKNLPTS